MSDAAVAAALRSDAPLVVIEAPAGCGKTYQGAEYARDMAFQNQGRVLIVTHTHAACGVFAERTKDVGRRVEIRTIDSLIAQIAGAYHLGLGLPADIATWTRRTRNGHALLAAKVALLLARFPNIAASLAARYPIIICDEHQDCSGDQHALIMDMRARGSRVRIFGDPMQHIYKEDHASSASPECDWTTLVSQADITAKLDIPHRWTNGCTALGAWTLSARETLRGGGKIDLRSGLPTSITVAIAENTAQSAKGLQLSDARPVYSFEKASDSLLILTRYNHSARACRGMFGRRLPLWEGHTRTALETLVDSIRSNDGDAGLVAAAIVTFMGEIGKGFSASAFGNFFESEAKAGCIASRRGKPAAIQALARHVVAQPDHRGVANMLRELAELRKSDTAFAEVELDHHSEFWDAVRLGSFEDIEAGLAEITNRRTYARPKPTEKAISTIHKAKGLETGHVVLMPSDGKNFPDKFDARCLLYVALSRATQRLLIIVSRDTPSPLFVI